MSEDIANPRHYTRLTIQPIEVIEDWQLGPHAANVVKYLARCGHKDGAPEIDELRKAKWYLDRLLWLEEKQAKAPPAEPAQVEKCREAWRAAEKVLQTVNSQPG